MKSISRIALAAGALIIASTAGLVGLAQARHADSGYDRHHDGDRRDDDRGRSYGRHHGGDARGPRRGGWMSRHHEDAWRGHHRGKRYGRRDRRRGWRGRHGHGYRGLMKRFDTDKDGKLTQDELNTARKDLLARHDDNKDGNISLNEFEKLWLEVKRRRMVRGFQMLDLDGDSSITTEEFLRPFADAVERRDRNNDGVLDKMDRRRRFGARRGNRQDGAKPRTERDNN